MVVQAASLAFCSSNGEQVDDLRNEIRALAWPPIGSRPPALDARSLSRQLSIWSAGEQAGKGVNSTRYGEPLRPSGCATSGQL